MPSRRSLSAALTVFALLTAGTAVPAYAQTAVAPVVVTPAQALAVLKGYTATVNTANKTYNTALRDTVEGGAARLLDDADYRLSTLLGYSTYLPIKDVSPRVLVPRQAHYPAVFVALTRLKYGTQPAGTYTYALLFQKASATAAWKMTASPDFSSADIPKFAPDKDGYLPSLDPSTLSVTPAALYPALLKAENLAGAGKKPSAAWAYNSLWRNYLTVPVSATLDVHESFASTHLAPVCLSSRTGALCIASSTNVEVDTLTQAELASGSRYVIDSQDLQYNAGGIAQGRYTQLRTVGQRQVAIIVPRKHSTTKLTVTGLLWGPISGTGSVG
jgi:hypothetical protein